MFEAFWKLPWWMKVPIFLVMLGYLGPKWINSWYDDRWEALAAPVMEIRDQKYNSLNERITSMDNKLDILILRIK